MTKRTKVVIFKGGTALAFTDYETEQLRKALLRETRHCAVTLGMKKTSVEQLTKAVGIAKGSFYKFYERLAAVGACGKGGSCRLPAAV